MATFLMFVTNLSRSLCNTYLVDYEFSVLHSNEPEPDPSADVAVLQINNVHYTYAFTMSCNITCMSVYILLQELAVQVLAPTGKHSSPHTVEISKNVAF